MDRNSLGSRGAPARRPRQLVAGALCTASFVAGQLLFGQEPAPQLIFNPFAQPAARAVQRADERAAASPSAKQAVVQEDEPRYIATDAAPVPVNRLRPAAITAVEEDQLPAIPLAPILSSSDAAPRKRAANKAAPLVVENTTFGEQEVAQASSRVEARPLPLDSAEERPEAAPADEADLPPIVQASAMPRRPVKRQPPANVEPASHPASVRPSNRPPARPAWIEDIRQSLSPVRRASQAR